MKPEINKLKDLEAKIKWLEKENEMLIMKSIAQETLVDVAEETLDISIKKRYCFKIQVKRQKSIFVNLQEVYTYSLSCVASGSFLELLFL